MAHRVPARPDFLSHRRCRFLILDGFIAGHRLVTESLLRSVKTDAILFITTGLSNLVKSALKEPP